MESNPVILSRPEEIISMESQKAAAPKTILKRTSLAIGPIKSRRPITPDGKFKCKALGCNFSTNYEFNLQRHAQCHNGKREGSSRMLKSTKLAPGNTRSLSKPMSEIFKCNRCSYSTAYKGNLKRHFATHPKKAFGCHHCEFRSRWKSNVTAHEKKKHSSFPRMISGKIKMGKVRVMNGMKTKKDQQRKCQMATSTSANNLLVSREGRFHCRDCDYTSNNKILFVSHIMKRHSDEEKSVPSCSYRCSRPYGKQEESSQRSKSTKFTPTKALTAASEKLECNQCSYSTAHKGNLKRHIATHSNDQAVGFGCHYCEYRSRWKQNVTTHEKKKHPLAPRMTSGQNKMDKVRVTNDMATKKDRQSKCQLDEKGEVFSCTFPGCAYRSKLSQWTRAHERRAHGFTRFQSKPQNKTAQASNNSKSPKVQPVKVVQRPPSKKITTNSSSGKLTPTKETSGSNEKVKCPQCELKCYPRFLQRHLMVHSNEKPFGCSVKGCDYRTRWPSGIKDHMRRHRKVPEKSTPSSEKSSDRQVRKSVKGKNPTVVLDQPEVDKEPSLVDTEEAQKESKKEAPMEPAEQVAPAEFACMLCDFVGYTEAAAWDHAKCHRQPLRPNDNLDEIPVILLD